MNVKPDYFVNINHSKNCFSKIFSKIIMFQNTSDRLISRITIESSNSWNKCLQPYIKFVQQSSDWLCPQAILQCVCAAHLSDVQVFYTSFACLLQLKSLLFGLQTSLITDTLKLTYALNQKEESECFHQLNYIFIQYKWMHKYYINNTHIYIQIDSKHVF